MTEIAPEYLCSVFIRGDANCNPKNTSRASLWDHFCSKHSFKSIDFEHPSHHHFTGSGLYDAQLDVLLYQDHGCPPEALSQIVCKLDTSLVDRAHDLIISKCIIPARASDKDCVSENIVAPKVINNRVKIIWESENLSFYKEIVCENLSRIRKTWSHVSPAAVSILLQSTNDILSSSAAASNKFIKLSKPFKPKADKNSDVVAAQARSLRLAKLVRKLEASNPVNKEHLEEAKRAASLAKKFCRRVSNLATQQACNKRDTLIHSILDTDPGHLFRSIKSSKQCSSAKIHSLNVGSKVYSGKGVPDGFYDSLSSLKAPDMKEIFSSKSFKAADADYKIIRKICSAGIKIPEIPAKDATEILFNMKSDVNDLFSVTPKHYINAGLEGVSHFRFLLNTIIQDINLFPLPELNSVWAMVLYKGHGKPRDSDRSYRTISTCPLLAKALDIYIGSLFESGWAAVQAETQFQGQGSSHDLAALLLTECVQHSIYVDKSPIFVLMLDAKSAFDKILKEFIVRNAFLAGSHGQALLYLADRLSSRKTFVEWDKCLIGPIFMIPWV